MDADRRWSAACTSAQTGGHCNAGQAERSDDPANCVDHEQGVASSGMLGVSGNVAEWTTTTRDGYFVSMGGSWAEARGSVGGCRSETPLHPRYRDALTGFRCARSEPRTLRADFEDAFF